MRPVPRTLTDGDTDMDTDTRTDAQTATAVEQPAGSGAAPRSPASQEMRPMEPTVDSARRRVLTAAERRRWWVLGTVGVAIGVALAVWFGLAATVGKVSWTSFGYKVDSPRQVTVTFLVDRPTGDAAVCTVRALARDFSTVGSVDVAVPPSSDRETRLRTVVATTSEAVRGEVQFCRKA